MEGGPSTGPTNDVSNENTERILAAISKTSEEIKEVKCAVQSVQQEISAIKDEMKEMRAQVSQVESAQRLSNIKISEVEDKCHQIEYNQEVIQSDIEAIAIHDEQYESRISNIEAQINIIEADRLKCSLRIFGIEETEDSENELLSLVKDRLFVAINDSSEFKGKSIVGAKRVGIKSGDMDDARMVIAYFERFEDKSKLFKHRNELRQCGISIANDLTYMQRQQLKEVRQRGLFGYFKNGKLVTYTYTHS